MRFLKYFVMFALPILLFFCLWRLNNMGDKYYYRGIGDALDYASTYPGWELTATMFNNLGSAFKSISNPSDILEWLSALFQVLFAPFTVLFTIISDIVQQIGWFFGWITGLAFL